MRECEDGAKVGWLNRLLSSPLFWVALFLGGLVLFILLFEDVPTFGVSKMYHIFE